MSKDANVGLRVWITLVALAVAGVHALFPRFIPDAITAGSGSSCLFALARPDYQECRGCWAGQTRTEG